MVTKALRLANTLRPVLCFLSLSRVRGTNNVDYRSIFVIASELPLPPPQTNILGGRNLTNRDSQSATFRFSFFPLQVL